MQNRWKCWCKFEIVMEYWIQHLCRSSRNCKQGRHAWSPCHALVLWFLEDHKMDENRADKLKNELMECDCDEILTNELMNEILMTLNYMYLDKKSMKWSWHWMYLVYCTSKVPCNLLYVKQSQIMKRLIVLWCPAIVMLDSMQKCIMRNCQRRMVKWVILGQRWTIYGLLTY